MVYFSVIWPSAIWHPSSIALKADVNVISRPVIKFEGTAAVVGTGKPSFM